MSTTLTPAQEMLVVELRRTLLLPLYDLLAVTHLFVAIDQATRWVLMRTYRDQTDKSSADFLRRLTRAAPMKIKTMGIGHRLCPPRHPQSNAMVERFNGRINDLVHQTRFRTAAELDKTLKHYLVTYNPLIPQQALKHQTPVQAIQQWRTKNPQLFVKCNYRQPGLDS